MRQNAHVFRLFSPPLSRYFVDVVDGDISHQFIETQLNGRMCFGREQKEETKIEKNPKLHRLDVAVAN